MFQKTKNIDTAFRHIRLFSVTFIIGCIIISVFIAYKSYQLASETQQKIYILANGKALEAYSADRKDNIPVEAKDHVKMFHHYFFSLDPDDKVIQSNITKALYLADGSAKQQYDNLKENGYYSNLIAGNISQEMQADSIIINTESYPYYFRYKGQQKIIRPTTIVIRSLITEGYLRNVSRSDNNSHGFLIEKWRTLENKDINTQSR
ncbi:conjugative transposon protein TraK [Terrimonas pollutisoli]|uniref:conjugative transposon protein TraK n=1 Tax=Terrimonas pollutisoli TaxID=3034147 RepID=UPI0023EE2832|nr:conjugative transposon protein TraK [Terrimonas sp. H1YJ31]